MASAAKALCEPRRKIEEVDTVVSFVFYISLYYPYPFLSPFSLLLFTRILVQHYKHNTIHIQTSTSMILCNCFITLIMFSVVLLFFPVKVHSGRRIFSSLLESLGFSEGICHLLHKNIDLFTHLHI